MLFWESFFFSGEVLMVARSIICFAVLCHILECWDEVANLESNLFLAYL